MKIPAVQARAARAVVIVDGIVEATAADPRARALFDTWSAEAVSGVRAIATRRDDWPALYGLAQSFVPSADAFVFSQLGAPLPYGPLLAYLLPLHYVTGLLEAEGARWTEPAEEIPAPRLPHVLPGRPGETTAQARTRLTALYRTQMTAIAAAESAARGPGRMPRDYSHLRQWGRWLYELELRATPRPSLKALEREIHERRRAGGRHAQAFPQCGCSGTVRKAVQAAKDQIESWLAG